VNTPQYEISISKIEESIVYFLVNEDFEMVAELCDLWLECQGTYSKNRGALSKCTKVVGLAQKEPGTSNTQVIMPFVFNGLEKKTIHGRT